MRKALWLLVIVVACAPTAPRPSIHSIEIATKPALEAGPQIDPNCYGINGARFPCIWFTLRDWKAIADYFLAIERELRAACLALGSAEIDCKASGR